MRAAHAGPRRRGAPLHRAASPGRDGSEREVLPGGGGHHQELEFGSEGSYLDLAEVRFYGVDGSVHAGVAGTQWKVSGSVTADASGGADFSITVLDKAGNSSAAVTAATDQTTVTLDTTAPTLSSVTLASSNAVTNRAKSGDTLTLAFTSSEKIPAPTVTLAGSSVSASNASGNGTDWQAVLTVATGDLPAVCDGLVLNELNGATLHVGTSSGSIGGPFTLDSSSTFGGVTFMMQFTPDEDFGQTNNKRAIYCQKETINSVFDIAINGWQSTYLFMRDFIYHNVNWQSQQEANFAITYEQKETGNTAHII